MLLPRKLARAGLLLILLWVCATAVQAGDDASGNIPLELDLSRPFSRVELSHRHLQWSRALAERLGYSGSRVHFVLTDIPVRVNGIVHTGQVYQSIEKPDFFYVIPGDAMLRLGAAHPYSPGVNGFSMHRSDDGKVIVSMNFQEAGVPFYSGTTVIRGKVKWQAHDYLRFQGANTCCSLE